MRSIVAIDKESYRLPRDAKETGVNVQAREERGEKTLRNFESVGFKA